MWNQRKPKAERPKYPKLLPITGTGEDAQKLLSSLLPDDPRAEIVDGGVRGAYVRVHNEAAEALANSFGETRSFPLA